MRSRMLVIAAVVLIALTGCLSLPSDGGVHVGQDGPPADGGLEVVAPGPSEDATPEGIVQGFLLASSFGLGDDFVRAREFMTAAGISSWNPLGGVTIYSDADPLEVIVEDEVPGTVGVAVTVRASVVATVAIDGTYTEVAPGATQDFHFQLVQVQGDQWRISQLDAGVLMSEVTFGTQYRDVPIYFLSGDDEPRFVPDLRWLPRARTVTGSVRALLSGAADWLSSPAVVTAFPSGTELGPDGVTIDDRVATVALSSEFLAASAVDRAYAQAQLSETLRQLGQVNRVQITVDGNVLPIDTSLAVVSLTPVPVRGPYVVADGGLALVSGGTPSPLDGYPVPEGLESIALPYGDGPIIGLLGNGSLVAMSEGATEATALQAPAEQLLAPSYDVHGWVWTGPTGSGSNTGTLTAIDPVSGATAEVTATDLAGLDVVALRVSREGSRLAYAVRTSTSVIVYVAAIERDTAGQPVGVSPGQPIGTPLASLQDLVWVDDVEVAVLAADSTSDPTVLLLGVGGQTAPLPSVEGAATIASGDGRRELFLVTEDGALYGRSGNGWRRATEDVSAPAFAG